MTSKIKVVIDDLANYGYAIVMLYHGWDAKWGHQDKNGVIRQTWETDAKLIKFYERLQGF